MLAHQENEKQNLLSPNSVGLSHRLSYTIKEAAAVTGLTRRQIEGAIIRGKLRAIKLERSVVIPASVLRRYVGEIG